MYINIHTHSQNSSGNILSIQNFSSDEMDFQSPPQKPLSTALHPWNISENNIYSELAQIRHYFFRYKNNEKLYAVGECGLDRLRGPSIDMQIEVFKKHLEIAESTNKPLIIHCVKAYPELIYLKKNIKSKIPWIIHGFQGNLQLMQSLLKHDFFISFGDAVTRKNKKKLHHAFKNCPENRFFLENDVSNIPIQKIYKSAARIKQLNEKNIIEMLYKNFRKCFIDK